MSVVALERNGAVATITIHRPERLNALNSEVIETFDGYLRDLSGDASVRAVLVAGAGERAFAAGADIGELEKVTGPDGLELCRRGQTWLGHLETLPQPSIAVIDGWALGGGCELALACTLRLGSTRAMLGVPEIKLGVIPGYGGTQRLAKIVGEGLAMEMVLTGEPISAARAYEIGLLNRVVSPERLWETARAFADQLASRPPLALRYGKRAVHEGLQVPLEEGLALEAAYGAILTTTEDKAEGIGAFLGKRKPVWKGR